MSLQPGDVIFYRGGAAFDYSRVVVRREGTGVLVLDAGWNDGRFLGRIEYDGRAPLSAPLPKEVEFPGLRTHGPRIPKKAGFADPALKLLAVLAPAEAEALAKAPWTNTALYTGYSLEARIARTGGAFRIESRFHEIDSGDMVRMDHDWDWFVLGQPLCVIGAYVGSHGKALQVCCEASVPADLVDAFLDSASAKA